jgi:hypothetical protein
MKKRRAIATTYLNGRRWLPPLDVTIDKKRNIIHHVDVGRHEDVIYESQVRIKKNLPPPPPPFKLEHKLLKGIRTI